MALLHVAPPCSAAAAVKDEETCPAGSPCAGATGAPAPPPLVDEGPEYPWPTVRGRTKPGLYSISPHKAPKSWEKKLAWSFPGARGNHSTVFNGGALIDDEGSIYTAAVDAVYKLDKNGAIKWVYPCATSTTPAIHGGALYSTRKDGVFFKLDMRFGTELWSTKVSEFIGGDIAGAGVSDGVFVGSSHGSPGGGDSTVTGVNASDGSVLWSYKADSQLWNFQPMFTGEGTFVFQDQIGGVYHLRTSTGEVLWTAGYKGPWAESWSDGVAMIGPNRLVYVAHADCHLPGSFSTRYQQCQATDPGTITAYRLDSGDRVWSQVTPYSPNSQPLVAKLGKNSGYSLVLPIGLPAGVPPSFKVFGWEPLPMWVRKAIWQFSIWLGDNQRYLWGNVPNPSIVQAYDAETGEKQWSWTSPVLLKGHSAGDEELVIDRSGAGAQAICVPNLWASPTIDAEGTIFVAHANGKIYAIRDANGDNAIDPEKEVTEFSTGVAFGHPGPAVAEGMMAIVNCDRVYVFKD
uniref:Pyrrolo-quinoline quinone repeat domain-containing protein n=1 Tax=Alexandrium catenella TaxID=2925 RepID=A0A7S1RKR1_ALECA